MLCHLGDATEMVLRIRPRERPVRLRHRRVVKLIALWSPIRWPHGWETTMSVRDWQRWAYKHTDHHLRQFGL